MNAIINEEMTLDEKLAAIDAELAKHTTGMNLSDVGEMLIATDPAELTMCVGCQ